jgi:hypothetical protein
MKPEQPLMVKSIFAKSIMIFLIVFSMTTPPLYANESKPDAFGNFPDVITDQFGQPQPAPKLFEPCKGEIKETCIKSIKATDAFGKVYAASQQSTTSFQWQSGVLVEMPDWKLNGYQFDYGSDLFGVSISQIPNEIKACSHDGRYCSDFNSGKLQLFIYPHFKSTKTPSPITFLGENNQEQCGTKAKPESCFAPPLFGATLNWSLELYVKPLEAGVLWGRSTLSDYLVLNKANSKIPFDLIEISAKNLIYPDFIFTEIRNSEISNRAKSDYVRDYLWLEMNYRSNSYTNYLTDQCSISITNENFVRLSSNAWNMNKPQWNSKSQSLEIKLSSPSFDHLGSKTKGYLEVAIPQTLAKCLWNVRTKSIAKLDVEVFYDNNNEKQVVTFSQASNENSIKLTANNFHYSSPTFAIKLPKGDEVSARAPSTFIESFKRTSIICVKGKTSKKIIGVDPKCPRGYKRK